MCTYFTIQFTFTPTDSLRILFLGLLNLDSSYHWLLLLFSSYQPISLRLTLTLQVKACGQLIHAGSPCKCCMLCTRVSLCHVGHVLRCVLETMESSAFVFMVLRYGIQFKLTSSSRAVMSLTQLQYCMETFCYFFCLCVCMRVHVCLCELLCHYIFLVNS